MNPSNQTLLNLSRRDMFQRVGAGIGSLALGSMLHQESHAADRRNPLAPRPPHHRARAKNIIYIHLARIFHE